MVLFLFLEFAAFVLLAYLLITQVLAPTIDGRPMFPMFRRKAKLVEELSQVREVRDEKELETEIAAEKSKLERE